LAPIGMHGLDSDGSDARLTPKGKKRQARNDARIALQATSPNVHYSTHSRWRRTYSLSSLFSKSLIHAYPPESSMLPRSPVTEPPQTQTEAHTAGPRHEHSAERPREMTSGTTTGTTSGTGKGSGLRLRLRSRWRSRLRFQVRTQAPTQRTIQPAYVQTYSATYFKRTQGSFPVRLSDELSSELSRER